MAEHEVAPYRASESAAGRSDEMPGIGPVDDAPDQASEIEDDASSERRKRISSSGD
jgi:hypothetical protein